MANEDTEYTDEAIEAIEAIVQSAENALELLPALDDILSGKAPLEGLRERSIAKGASEALVEVRWRIADAEEARSFANSIGLEHLSVVAAMQELNAAALQAATRAQAAEAGREAVATRVRPVSCRASCSSIEPTPPAPPSTSST